ncbi:MAG: hypothetical protein FWE50_01750 [Alphaproteobacteria bacterium]|nr:hypothetical protein [Alphaproteobacteria bacterium]
MAGSDKKSLLFSKNSLLWTGWYFVASYLIFLLVFNFNILHSADWAKIPLISLHGFGGLAFGVALFAWFPIWLAGVFAISRTGKPLFGASKSSSDEAKSDEAKPLEEPEPKIEFPKNLPEEMRVPYSRMLRGQLSRGAMDCRVVQNNNKAPATALSAECTPSAGEDSADSEMALPDSFDVEPADNDDIPMFRDISFDEPQVASVPSDNIKIETIKNKKFAIITHDDSDFWIADEDNWFATGKQKASPITAVISAAKENDATPVLHLISENIMDLDSQKEKWRANSVLIIKDISELN